MSELNQKNVFGSPLESCSKDPLTGWYRDGCCNTDDKDKSFIQYVQKYQTSFVMVKEVGNDLITPHPEFGFPGLKNGDCWCVCATWYARALKEGKMFNIFKKNKYKNSRTNSFGRIKKICNRLILINF